LALRSFPSLDFASASFLRELLFEPGVITLGFGRLQFSVDAFALASAAAQRDDRCLLAPRNLKGGAAQKVTTKLIDGGLVKEIKAKPMRRCGGETSKLANPFR
jgi:hypothetical protein